jgi:predicted ATPase/DNA-binding XRE family transcriptional regulator
MPTSDTKVTNSSAGELDFPLFFGDWLKRRRKQFDMTQAELAERACCSIFALRKIEAGERRPSKQLAGMLAKPLEIPTADQTSFIKVARGELGIEKLPSLVNASQPAGKSSPIPGNLPRELTPFIGREPELTALAQLLQDPQCSLLTIVGPGGIGKTRLSIEAVHSSKGLFPDGTWFVSLAPLNSPVLIVPAIADAVGFKFQDPTDPQAELLRYLRPKRALLVLDNAEHLLEGAGVFTEILKNCHQIKLLVTSRERLNLLSEWVFEIQGLPVPTNDQLNQFDTYSSVALFLQSARRVQAGFEIRSAERQWVLKICEIMEGMPLGIELSAAWVGLLSIEEIAKEIEHNLDFLSVSMRDLPERHRSLRATLDHSWKLLNPDEKLILSRLSVFHGSFSREAAQAICGASLTVLSSLKNKSLVHRTDHDDYGLHEIIHQYAALKLAELPDENEQIKDQHAMYFVQYLSDCEAALQSSKQVETFDDMAKIIDNLSQGWQHLVTHCLPGNGKSKSFPADLLHSSLFSISLFYEMRCRSLEAITIFKDSVDYLNAAQADYEKTEDGYRVNSVLGHITAYLGLHHYYVLQYEKSIEYMEEAIKVLDNCRSRVEKAQVQVMLAAVRSVHLQLRESAALLEQSREVFREEGVDWWYTLSTIHLASRYLTLGNLREGEALIQEGLRLVIPGDLRLELPLRISSSALFFHQKDFAKAEQILQNSLQLSYRLGNILQTADILFDLGRVALADHRVELAEEYLQKSIAILLEFGESHDLALASLYLGKCFATHSDRNAARYQFRHVIRIGQERNEFHLVYFALVNIARTYITEDQTEKALEIFLLLRHCPQEYIRIQEDFDQLQSDLVGTLTERQIETVMNPDDSQISPDDARVAVITYAQELETGRNCS